LAISLNAAFEEKRRAMMPISFRYPLEQLLPSLRYYVHKTKKRITIEYVLMAEKNDSLADAKALLRFTSRLPSKINLIPCNTDHDAYRAPSPEKIQFFHDYLIKHNRTVTIRSRKGWEIQAACGQLRAKNISDYRYKEN